MNKGSRKMSMAVSVYLTFALAAAAPLLAGCLRGRPSKKPPIHVNPNMDNQPKYRAQGRSAFFADSSAMRVPVAGTVARGESRADSAYYAGRDADGEYIKRIPVEVTAGLLRRGRERFNIYCAVCHDRAGHAQGIVMQRGFKPPPQTYHGERVRKMPDGQIFNIITNGSESGIMKSYRHQVPVPDRWAIVAYVRALQRSQNASIDDIPPEQRDRFE